MVQGAQNGARWGSGASDVHFSEMFIKQKLLGTLNIEGVCHLYGPQIWTWTKCASGAVVLPFQEEYTKSKL